MDDIVGLITRKRDGGELAPAEIEGLITGYLADEVDDAQMSALLMAGVINGFSDEEASALTRSLVASGRSVDLSGLVGPTVDKHSTGGVGDVTTLVVAPLLAAAGCRVAKLSGRGLGHTGGTLDKLEAIPGCTVDLDRDRFLRQVERLGVAVAASGPDLVPADRRLYALRDVTGTVEDPALIASSVMSKKLAGGAANILLDVKVGSGAFLADPTAARRLAERCVAIGQAHGRRTAAVLTQMAEPLSEAVGNALEVAAAVEVLRGRGGERLRALCIELAAVALHLTGADLEDARQQSADILASRRAEEVFREMVHAQGGDPEVTTDPWSVLPVAPVVEDWLPPPGRVQRMDTRGIGEIARRLGAGRTRLGDVIDPAVGLEIWLRTGEQTSPDQPGARIHARSGEEAAAAGRALDAAIVVGDGAADPLPLVLGTVGLPGADQEP